MVMFLATKLKVGAKATKFSRGRWSVDNYFHMYYNETSGIDLSLGRPHETWKGSDNHTVFCNHPTKGIGRRAMHCECAKCRVDEHLGPTISLPPVLGAALAVVSVSIPVIHSLNFGRFKFSFTAAWDYSKILFGCAHAVAIARARDSPVLLYRYTVPGRITHHYNAPY